MPLGLKRRRQIFQYFLNWYSYVGNKRCYVISFGIEENYVHIIKYVLCRVLDLKAFGSRVGLTATVAMKATPS